MTTCSRTTINCLYTDFFLFLDEEDDTQDNLNDPIDQSNIIQGGRRTRGKVIDYSKISTDEMEDDDDDDEEYESREDNQTNDDDDEMRD